MEKKWWTETKMKRKTKKIFFKVKQKYKIKLYIGKQNKTKQKLLNKNLNRHKMLSSLFLFLYK